MLIANYKWCIATGVPQQKYTECAAHATVNALNALGIQWDGEIDMSINNGNNLWIGHQNEGLQLFDQNENFKTFSETKGLTIWKRAGMRGKGYLQNRS